MKKQKYSRAATQPSWWFSNQISITGETGVGTTTAEKNLKSILEKRPFRFVSGGNIMRAFGDKNGMNIDQFAEFNRKNPHLGFDKKCDDWIALFATHNFVIGEGRLPHVFMPHSYHVLLVLEDLNIRAERRVDQGTHGSAAKDAVVKFIKDRDANDNKRYEEIYPECLWPESDYDLVIDTSTTEPGDVIHRIIEGHKLWRSKIPEKKIIEDLMEA